jgi:2-hydroxychromene-2-carboxylate isomerase
MSEAPEIEMFFDVASTYSYLAFTQLPRLRERTGAKVRLRPFLLGGVFKESGNEMPARIPNKARWLLSDVHLWAKRYDVPFRMNSRFPLNTLSAQRALVAADRDHGPEAMERFATELFKAAWVEDRDLASGDEIAACANAAGLDVHELAKRVSDPEIKEALKEATAEAVRRGAFGAPTFFTSDAMFWGNDRLELLEEHVRGAR